jgi:hypothetical protein
MALRLPRGSRRRRSSSGRTTTPRSGVGYGISRKTGYKWLERFEEDGKQGLSDRSRAPKHCPHRIDEPVAKTICEARLAHPTWGPTGQLTI